MIHLLCQLCILRLRSNRLEVDHVFCIIIFFLPCPSAGKNVMLDIPTSKMLWYTIHHSDQMLSFENPKRSVWTLLVRPILVQRTPLFRKITTDLNPFNGCRQ
jgi:hypothetical protein